MLFDINPVGLTIDKSRLAFDIIKYSSSRIALVLMEKDKGGTGSTSSAMSLVELCLWLSIDVHIIDLADTQLDLATPYTAIAGVTVHEVPPGDHNAERGHLLRALNDANLGDIVIVQYPGSSIARIDRMHQFLNHVQARTTIPVDVSIVWTMDGDRNSRDLLKLTLESNLPGTLHVNWPTWNGQPDIRADVAGSVAAQGGKVFSIPALDAEAYRAFKADARAPRQAYLDGDFATKMELDFWLKRVAEAVGLRT